MSDEPTNDDQDEYYPDCLGCAKGDCWGPDDNGRCGCCGRFVQHRRLAEWSER